MAKARFLALALLLMALAGSVPAGESVLQETLPNGIRILAVHQTGDSQVLFVFLPLGLTSDPSGGAQWSHLLEHLVIRSTHPLGSDDANGETLPDHMRLDLYGRAADLDSQLASARKWLAGPAFATETIRVECGRMNQEVDYAVKNRVAHKFAVAAWNQAFRHGRSRVAVRSEPARATPAQLAELYAARSGPLVCVGGPVPAETSLNRARKALADLKLPRGKVARAGKPAAGPIHWDLPVHHTLLIWPIPGPEHPDHPALMLLGPTVMVAASQDRGWTAGPLVAGADLFTPEGCFFYASYTGPVALRARVEGYLARPRAPWGAASSLADSLTRVQPAGGANAVLQLAMAEYRYGPRRSAVASGLSRADLEAAARRYLTSERAACWELVP
ncbi:MAG: hypothetical protein AB1758_37570 [Candidatus Eremiobacterota bacterium]